MDSKKLYDYIVESGEIAKSENVPMDEVIDEGLFSALLGSAVSATIG